MMLFEDLLLQKFKQRFQSRYCDKYTEKIKRQKHIYISISLVGRKFSVN